MTKRSARLVEIGVTALVCLVIGVLILYAWAGPRLSIYYNLWRLEREQLRIDGENCSEQGAIEMLLEHPESLSQVEMTKTAKWFVEIGPEAVPYIHKRMKQNRLTVRGMAILMDIYLRENHIESLGTLASSDMLVFPYERDYGLSTYVWFLVESDDPQLREFGLVWLHVLGEIRGEKEAGKLAALSADEGEKASTRELALRLLEKWDPERCLSTVKEISQQGSLEEPLKSYCRSVLTRIAEKGEAEFLYRGKLHWHSAYERRVAARELSEATSPPDPEAVTVLIELLSSDHHAARMNSYQNLNQITGLGIGTRYLLETSEDVSYEEYLERLRKMSKDEKDKWDDAVSRIWCGEDDTTRKAIAEEWRAWYEKEYGARRSMSRSRLVTRT